MTTLPPLDAPATDLVACATPDEAVARLSALYQEAHDDITRRFDSFVANGTAPAREGAPTYPYLCAEVSAEATTQTSKL
ncbi:MAG: hypothetical protein ACX939_14735, partial [Hyphococcus sp.]